MLSSSAKIQSNINKMRQSFENTPTYQIPEEAKQLLALYQNYGQQLEGLKGYGEEATGIAKAQTGAIMPGMGIASEMLKGSTAGTVQNIVEAGGGGAGSLRAIAQAGQSELNAMRDLAIQNQQYRQQAESEYRQSLLSQAGLESSLLGQSANMQAAGLGMMIGEKGKQYQSELDKTRNLQQFDIVQLGNKIAEEQAKEARRIGTFSNIISGIGSIVGAVVGGGAGAIAGNRAGQGVNTALTQSAGLNSGQSSYNYQPMSNFNYAQTPTINTGNLPAGSFGSGQLGQSAFYSY